MDNSFFRDLSEEAEYNYSDNAFHDETEEQLGSASARYPDIPEDSAFNEVKQDFETQKTGNWIFDKMNEVLDGSQAQNEKVQEVADSASSQSSNKIKNSASNTAADVAKNAFATIDGWFKKVKTPSQSDMQTNERGVTTSAYSVRSSQETIAMPNKNVFEEYLLTLISMLSGTKTHEIESHEAYRITKQIAITVAGILGTTASHVNSLVHQQMRTITKDPDWTYTKGLTQVLEKVRESLVAGHEKLTKNTQRYEGNPDELPSRLAHSPGFYDPYSRNLGSTKPISSHTLGAWQNVPDMQQSAAAYQNAAMRQSNLLRSATAGGRSASDRQAPSRHSASASKLNLPNQATQNYAAPIMVDSRQNASFGSFPATMRVSGMNSGQNGYIHAGNLK